MEIEMHLSEFLTIAEWCFTLIFTIEYLLRIYTAPSPMKYVKSFFGVIDLIAIIPTYLAIFIAGTHYLMVVRTLRLLRIFRILKLAKFVGASKVITDALVASRAKIFVFLFAVLNSVIILGTLMYLIEGAESGFTSIPRSIYWAIVTLTTVGYGDIAPATILGQFLASIIMIMGYSVIAVPTGIVTAELNLAKKRSRQLCPDCETPNDKDAHYCKHCGCRMQKEFYD